MGSPAQPTTLTPIFLQRCFHACKGPGTRTALWVDGGPGPPKAPSVTFLHPVPDIVHGEDE